MKKHRQLLEDAPAYVAGFGTYDKQGLYDALQCEGQNAVVRLGFNVQDPDVPYRMLGYLTAAYYITNLYFPKAQLQIVANPNAAERVNGQNADHLSAVARKMLTSVHQDTRMQALRPANAVFASDTAVPNEIDPAHIAAALAGTAVQENLRQSAERRSADHLAYVAAHLLIHDTLDSIEPLEVDGFAALPLQSAETIISIGAAPERNFYEARMRCKQQGVELPGVVAASTAQIFTKHLIAPYLYSRIPGTVDPPHTNSRIASALLERVGTEGLSSTNHDILYPWLMLGEVEIAQEIFGSMPSQQLSRNIQLSAAEVDYWHPRPNAFAAPHSLYES